MNKVVLLFCTVLLSCASTQSIIIPIGDFPSYKKTMGDRGQSFVKADTVKGADGKMVVVYFRDKP